MGNQADGDGGAVAVDSLSDVVITDTTFTDNTAGGLGGDVFIGTDSELEFELNASYDAEATEGGSVYTDSRVGLSIDKTIFSGSISCRNDGGAHIVDGHGEQSWQPVLISDSTISNAIAGRHGGAFYGPETELELDGAEFDGTTPRTMAGPSISTNGNAHSRHICASKQHNRWCRWCDLRAERQPDRDR